MAGTRQGGRNRELIVTTASITLSPNDIGKTITNLGASGAVVITLPTATTCTPGGDILILSAADQDLTVSCATADTIIGFNDLDLDSVAFAQASEKIGGALWCTCLGAKWHVAYLTEETQTNAGTD